MAEFRENWLNDDDNNNGTVVKIINARFGLSLSPYDPLQSVLVKLLRHLGVAVNDAASLNTCLELLLNRVS